MEELTICNLLPLQSLHTRNNRGGGRRGNPVTNSFRCNIAVICRLLCALFVLKQNRISSVAYASLPTLFFFLSCAAISAQKGENMLRCEIGNHPERYGLISPISWPNFARVSSSVCPGLAGCHTVWQTFYHGPLSKRFMAHNSFG